MSRVKTQCRLGVGVGSARRTGAAAGRVLAVSAVFCVLFGCSSPEKLGGVGAPCLLFTDCAAGLVCVPASPSSMQCSRDPSSLFSTEEAGAPADATVVVAADGAAPPIEEATGPSNGGGGGEPEGLASSGSDSGVPPQPQPPEEDAAAPIAVDATEET